MGAVWREGSFYGYAADALEVLVVFCGFYIMLCLALSLGKTGLNVLYK